MIIGWTRLICRFPDRETALSFAAQLGAELAPDTIDYSGEDFAMSSFTQEGRTGYFVNLMLSDTPGGQAALEAVKASGYVVELEAPSVMWI